MIPYLDYLDYLAVVLVLGVLIFVHELGHFLAAKSVGIGVPRFSIGLGPITPLRFRRGETEYVLSWVPFGGYVKMASREELDELESLEGGQVETPFPPEQLFENQPLAARIFVISAGVAMNAVFAWLAFTAWLFVYGRPEDPTTRIAEVDAAILPESARALAEVPFGAEVVRLNGEPVTYLNAIFEPILDPEVDELRFGFAGGIEPIVLDVSNADEEDRRDIARALTPLWEARVVVTSDGAAARGGIRTDDLITAIGGEPVRCWDDMVRIVERNAGKELRFSVVRDGQPLEVDVTPIEEEVTDRQTGLTRKVGRIGVSGPLYEPLRLPVGLREAVAGGAREVGRLTVQILGYLKGMVMGEVSFRELGGPVLIAKVSAQAAQQGLEALLRWMAFLSVNLAILNLLPIPVLDGGHLVFLVLEGLRRGRPVPKELRQRLTLIGFYFLLAFMTLVVINDLLR